MPTPTVAFVLSDHEVSEVTGWPIGFWMAELSHPYHEFAAAGIPGTTFVAGPPMDSHAIADGNLITGQQQHSGAEAARLAIGLLS